VRRPGHHRPIGSETAYSRFSWHDAPPPELGDVAFEVTGPGGDPDELERGFMLIGIIETSSRDHPYRLKFERLDYADATARAAAGASTWHWWRVR
jgi:hypothetical protein